MSHDQRIHRQGNDATKAEGKDPVSQARQESGVRPEARPLSEHRQVRPLSVALVHDWLNGMRGGEIVFEALLDLYPDADVYTLIYEPRKLSPSLQAKLAKTRVHASWMNLLRFTRRNYRQLLPLLPFAIRSLDVYPYDLVISSSHCVAKGVKKRPGAVHVSYIHAPMRYMWDRFDDYFGKGRIHPLIRLVALVFRPLLRGWDRRTASPKRVDVLVSNSDFIGKEIERVYGRSARTIYPFARLERFSGPRNKGGYYLMVGAFAPYKRTDLAIEAFARLGLPLKIVGSGQDEERLKALKKRLRARNVEFIPNPGNEQIEALYAGCKAFVFPGKEDFGITPLEAMAAGAPVIAYAEGGACETVTPKTGILFKRQTVEALCEAVMDLESGRKYFLENECRARAAFFTEERFKAEIRAVIEDAIESAIGNAAKPPGR
jgi:glycosyltransferase involved in cell wall biosynthesis